MHPVLELKLQLVHKDPLKKKPGLQVKQAVDLMQVWQEEWHVEQLDPKYPSLQIEQKVALVHFKQLFPHKRHFWPFRTKYLGWQVKITFYRQVNAFGYREQDSQVPED